MCRNGAVKAGESSFADIGYFAAFVVQFAFESKLVGDNFLCPEPHAFGNIFRRNGDLVTSFVDPSDDDMDVWVIGVVVVDGGPFEFATEIFFNLLHHLFGEVGEVEFMAVFR